MSYDKVRVLKNFYISSRFKNRLTVLALAKRFETELQLEWFRGQNWAAREGQTPLDHPAAPQLAQGEIEAAAFADLFVKILTPERSPGAFGELSARLVMGRPAHVIVNKEPLHLFHRHPQVRLYRDEDHFWDRLTRHLHGDEALVWPGDAADQPFSNEPY